MKFYSNSRARIFSIEHVKMAGSQMELVAFAPQTGGNLAAFVPQTGGKLAEWGLTLQSSLDEYWEQAAVRCHTRSAHQQAACRKIPDIFDDKQGATTVEMMLALHKHQAEECIVEGGGSPGWANAVEFNVGLRFKQLGGAPDSAALGVTKEKALKLENRCSMSKYVDAREKSLAQMLMERNPDTQGVPKLPLAIKRAPQQTDDPSKDPIVSNDCKRIIAEVRAWLLVEFKKVNYDEEGCRLIGQSLQATFPGGPALRNGKSTPWWKKLHNAGNNMRNHSVSA